MVDTDDTRRTTDHRRQTTDDRPRTTPQVWHKLPTGELTKGFINGIKLEWCWFLLQSAKTMSTPAHDLRRR